jgi:hypothetical protein
VPDGRLALEREQSTLVIEADGFGVASRLRRPGATETPKIIETRLLRADAR